ncbi:response regulator [Pelotalea chapellei]|uniref:Response regulator n=1 Tax=Pelotalea chapellei TaxID=44671 RepID=A0ABS5U8B4_9BACT|nr:response regulator [Pelotalea chapellei]MBT1071907.1 response regulator [Pelotalea chapellei]
MKNFPEHSSLHRIILVDGDSQMLQMLEMFLSREYHIVTARSAEEALELMSTTEPFQAALVSFSLPGMNGLNFLLRVSEAFPQTVRILMTSSFGDMDGIVKAIREGDINRIMVKPFSMSTLLEQLRHDVAEQYVVTGTILENYLQGESND